MLPNDEYRIAQRETLIRKTRDRSVKRGVSDCDSAGRTFFLFCLGPPSYKHPLARANWAGSRGPASFLWELLSLAYRNAALAAFIGSQLRTHRGHDARKSHQISAAWAARGSRNVSALVVHIFSLRRICSRHSDPDHKYAASVLEPIRPSHHRQRRCAIGG